MNINFHLAPNELIPGVSNFEDLNFFASGQLNNLHHHNQAQSNLHSIENQAPQQKKISLKKLEEECSKTLDQAISPNSSTINLENLKKTQSLHYMKAASGTSSPTQTKSRSAVGRYVSNGVPYNNLYNNSSS